MKKIKCYLNNFQIGDRHAQDKKEKRNYGTNLSGVRIRAARNRKKIGQSELVAILEVEHNIKLHRSALGLIEQQKRSVSDIELAAFSKVLEVSILWLLFGEEKKDSRDRK